MTGDVASPSFAANAPRMGKTARRHISRSLEALATLRSEVDERTGKNNGSGFVSHSR